MAPDTWDPATCQGSIEAGGTSPYISILDDKTQIWILNQSKACAGLLLFRGLKGGKNREGGRGQQRCNVYVTIDKGDKRNGPDLDPIEPG